MSYGEFCEHFEIAHSPDAFVVWLYYAFYTRPAPARPTREAPHACGPHLPNGNPEFGWRQFQAPPIQHEAAAEIERLRKALEKIAGSPTKTGTWCRGVADAALNGVVGKVNK